MENIFNSFKIVIHEGVFKKDPETSDLGKSIVGKGIDMIDAMGFESFTFKKLGEQIGSNESSIYRYFESKHMLLLYLASWYWGWVEYKIVLQTMNIKQPDEQLRRVLEVLSGEVLEDKNFSHVNEVALHRVIINEYSKSYLTKTVDSENKEGYFSVYKRLVGRISGMIKEMNPTYAFPESLSSTLLEGTLHQQFLRDHFPTITNCNKQVLVHDFFFDMVFNCLKR
ncbi:MAG: TetR/AcrR family transcriptional regulator [Flavobacteriaceae bacterium]